MQTDAYAGYNKVYTLDTCARIACLAHDRRKFIDVQETAKKEVQKILSYIASLYRLDIKVRAVKGVVILEQLFQYLESVKLQTLPRAPLMDALNYALTQKDEIFRIISDDLFDLDNNAIERQMKKIAVGRKNYLFAGSHEGAHAAAVFYSLLGSCKLNNVNPWDWLKDVLTVFLPIKLLPLFLCFRIIGKLLPLIITHQYKKIRAVRRTDTLFRTPR